MDAQAIQLLFTQEIPEGHPRLRHLYEKAKGDFWNETTDINWDQPCTLSAEEKERPSRAYSVLPTTVSRLRSLSRASW